MDLPTSPIQVRRGRGGMLHVCVSTCLCDVRRRVLRCIGFYITCQQRLFYKM